MINEKNFTQQKLEMVYLEDLVPKDHILRNIDKYMDFSFIRELTKKYYCLDNGRPGVDPILLFKMLFIGYLFGIKSERQLVKEIEVNVAYRWFLGLSLTDTIPDHSTISQNRRRRFKGTDVFQKIFDEVVFKAINLKMVTGKILYTDSTHLKANANKRKLVKIEVEKTPKEYVAELNKAVEEDRINHGKKPLKEKEPVTKIKETKVSTTDPDSGYMMRDGKPEGFSYLDHRTVDSRHNIITDVYVTPGNINDVDPYIDRLDVQIKKFNFNTKYVGADAGYATNLICKKLYERELKSVMGYRRSPHTKGMYTKNKFQYVKEQDIYVCPDLRALHYKTTTREGYKEYVGNAKYCDICPNRAQCFSAKSKFKTIRRHVWETYKEDVVKFTRTDKGRNIYRRRKETIERSFADSKQLHGLRYCHMRGLENVQEQCLLTAAVQNMKKIASLLSLRFFDFLTKNIVVILNLSITQNAIA
ncbi:IS1182 family transposase [Clostridium estertheticum]|uniref:IS1182 family transposase n=1 Tax=Clostridium estertheticum TaxID=238834 RepID=UPI001CCAFF95|nr:IS1182 family transposase [Clostridium estertheticum]MBZ9606322.1 IS1182 family transposase [Clostridium estertheticum]MBZ9607576.1 IS1182 family transposase [Clostridium estertheticum]MBZ9607935.1 IS1182 family transposase [Clostridium estertheticum]MBZ9607954.1 IS1182 family transposase [Clostridium estertheticum]MBZ9608122.1 IS1182 family transposase [Clostridium estertheticum]